MAPRIAVLWDVDGTLSNSEPTAMRIAVEMLVDKFALTTLDRKDLGLAARTTANRAALVKDLIEAWAGRHFTHMIDECELLPERGPLDDVARGNLAEECFVATVEALNGAELNTGIEETLWHGAGKGYVQTVVTSSHEDRVEPCITAVKHFFRNPRGDYRLYSAATIQAGPSRFNGQLSRARTDLQNKPAPDIYVLALETEGLDPKATMAIEDSMSGVKAALGAGVKVIGYVGGEHIVDKAGRKAEMEALGVVHIVEDGRRLKSAIDAVAIEIAAGTPSVDRSGALAPLSI